MAVVSEPGFADIVKRLIEDHKSGVLPTGKEEGELDSDFDSVFKGYVKALGKDLGLKGKGLFHPVRLALTGRVSGPDIGDQLKLLALAEGVLPEGKYIPLTERIEVLESLNVAALTSA